MKIRRILVIGVLLAVVVVLGSVALVFHWQHSEQTFNVLPKLALAEQHFVRDLASRGQPLPTSVTLQDLVTSGYISTDEVRPLEGADVTFYPRAIDTSPQTILIRVRMSDGSEIVALADGSVEQVPK
jgi:hypothetical protein